MHSSNFFLILFFLLLAVTSNKLIELDDSNYEQWLNSTQFGFVTIQSSDCPLCPETRREMEASSGFLETLNISVGYIDVNSTKSTETLKHFKIEFVPTISIIENKTIKYYHALIKSNAIITYLKKVTDLTIKNLTSIAEIEDFMNPLTHYMNIIILKNITTANQDFVSVNNMGKFCEFAYCLNDVCHKYFKKYIEDDYVIAQNFKDKYLKQSMISFKFTKQEDLIDQMLIYALPTLSEFSDFAAELMIKLGIKAIFLIKTNPKKNDENIIVNYLLKEKKKEFYAFVLDANNENDLDTIEFFGYEKSLVKNREDNIIFALAFPKNERRKKYEMTEKINQKNFEIFMQNYTENKLEETIISEAEPDNQPKKNLIVVVGKTFRNTVLKNKLQEVIVAYTIPGHWLCDNVMKAFENLSEKYSNRTDLLFVTGNPFSNDFKVISSAINRNDLPIIEYYGLDKSEAPTRFKGKFDEGNIDNFIKNGGKNVEIIKEVDTKLDEETTVRNNTETHTSDL